MRGRDREIDNERVRCRGRMREWGGGSVSFRSSHSPALRDILSSLQRGRVQKHKPKPDPVVPFILDCYIQKTNG